MAWITEGRVALLPPQMDVRASKVRRGKGWDVEKRLPCPVREEPLTEGWGGSPTELILVAAAY